MTSDKNDHRESPICTDSNALCQSLINPDIGELALLKRSLEKLPANISINWVPAHVDIPGNELADQAAKEATELDEPDRGISFNTIKQLIKRNVQDPPISHPLSSEVYQHYKLSFDECLTNRKDQTLVAKLRTGKYKGFREYKSRLDKGATDPTLSRKSARFEALAY